MQNAITFYENMHLKGLLTKVFTTLMYKVEFQFCLGKSNTFFYILTNNFFKFIFIGFNLYEFIFEIALEFNLKRCLVRSILVGLAVTIGEFIPRFDLVMGVIGGSLTGPLIFILPPLFYAKICKMEKNHDLQLALEKQRRILTTEDDDDDTVNEDEIPLGGYGTFYRTANIHNPISSNCFERCCGKFNICKLLISDCVLSLFVILFGIAATLTSTYYSILHVANLKEFWSPCINNISYSFGDL